MHKPLQPYIRIKYPVLLLTGLWFAFLTWQAKGHPFFWDTVQLSSKHAFWFYENNFQSFFLPEVIDSGHPPFFGMGLAALWKVFGQHLWVGHLAMFPFLIGIVLLSYKIAAYFYDGRGVVFLLLLIAVDPFILGQSVLVSPDVPVLCGWLLGIYAILYRRNEWKIVAALLLAMMSMRGMMLVVALFLFDVLRAISFKDISIKWLWQKVLPYVPSGLLGLAFLLAHYQHTGWIGYHADSSWAPSFEKVGLAGAMKNTALIIWRLLDFGRIALCLLLFFGGGYYFYKKQKTKENNRYDDKSKSLFYLLAISVVVLTPSLIMHKHLSAHRYLMPITTVMSFVGVLLVLKIFKRTFLQNIVAGLLIVSLLLGNFWVYPNKIAQGWDATLGHWPYYSLREQMLDYIVQQEIPLEKIGTAFPNNADMKYIDLKPGVGAMPLFDLQQQSYILYSNIYNDFPDEVIDELESNWIIKKQYDRYPVSVILYQKK